MKRIYLLIVLLFTAIAAGAQIKVAGGPYLQNVTEDSFTVIWTTTGPAVGWIEVARHGKKAYRHTAQGHGQRTGTGNHIPLQGNVPRRALAGEQGQNRL